MENEDVNGETRAVGACLLDPELHDGPAGAESAEERAAREDVAREVCGTCPLAARCLAYALRARPRRGIWAGLTAEQVNNLAELLSTPAPSGVRLTLDEVACLLTASPQFAPATAVKLFATFAPEADGREVA